VRPGELATACAQARVRGKPPPLRLQYAPTGLPAWWSGQPGQVGNQAAL